MLTRLHEVLIGFVFSSAEPSVELCQLVANLFQGLAVSHRLKINQPVNLYMPDYF